jgi:histidinol-phosphate aminotransferase
MGTKVIPQPGLAAMQPYTPGKPIEEVQREYGLTDVIKLASNENPLGASPKVLAALHAALDGINLYPDGDNYSLRHRLADHLRVAPEQVTIGNGADGLIRQICEAFVADGDEVIVSRSSFPVYDAGVHIMRGKLVKTPLKPDLGIDLGAMAAAVTDRTKLIVVCNPNNPTGTIVTAAELDTFVQAVPENVLIVLDEAYLDYVDAPDYPDSLDYVRSGRGNVLVLRTFSKNYGVAGLRLGFAIGVSEVLAPINGVKETFSVNRLAQVAGLAALEDGAFLEESIAVNRAGRLYLCDQFSRLGLDHLPGHTNFVLVRIGPDAKRVYEELLAQGLIVRPCAGYELPDYLRISIGTPEQNQRLIAVLETVL